ncbi:MAG: hypothetical protein ACE5G3_05100 [Gammaproteobacteria bacterium]
MRIGTATEITELLRSLPDMPPPAGSWHRVRKNLRRRNPFVWSGAALAACAALVAVVLLTRGAEPIQPVANYLVNSEPAPRPDAPVDAGAANAAERSDVRDLRRRSQQMERLLRGLPPRTQLVRADVAGAIAELQDRIAAIDYELNRAALDRADGRWTESGAIARWPAADHVNGYQSTGPARALPPGDLWRQRVDLMDSLVRVRYAEAGVEAH